MFRHIKRANYFAKLRKTCLDLELILLYIQIHGWLDSRVMQRMEEVFLKSFCDYLILVREEIAHVSDTEIDSESDKEFEGYVIWT